MNKRLVTLLFYDVGVGMGRRTGSVVSSILGMMLSVRWRYFLGSYTRLAMPRCGSAASSPSIIMYSMALAVSWNIYEHWAYICGDISSIDKPDLWL